MPSARGEPAPGRSLPGEGAKNRQPLAGAKISSKNTFMSSHERRSADGL